MKHLSITRLNATIVVLAGLITACGSSNSTTSPTAAFGGFFSPSWLAANQNGSGSPANGGTLTVMGNSDVDHLDPTSGYTGWSWQLERAYARQLYTYPADTNLDTAYAAVPDIASGMPVISNNGTTYTVTLRSDAMWNTTPPRPVTAADFVRGFQRLCNPAAPSGGTNYYIATIAGFNDFCTAYGNVATTAPAMQAFTAAHQISGIQAPNATTLVFTLTAPASDFVNILALPFSSAAPVEYDSTVPDSADFHSHIRSDGPYAVTGYTAGQEIDLDRNPAWNQAADPVRHQYVDHIKVVLGHTDQDVEQQIEAGTADIGWDTTVPPSSIAGLENRSGGRDARLGVFPSPQLRYLAFNLQSSGNGGALKKAAIRQALEYAPNKAAVVKIFGGAELNQVLNQAIPPGQTGHVDSNAYPSSGDQGDPAKCTQMLAAAGASALTLKIVYPNLGPFSALVTELTKDFAACGVTLTAVPVSNPGDLIANYVGNPQASAAGAWDLAPTAFSPDWFDNNGRALIVPIFDGRHYGPGSADYGDYNNPAVNSLIDKALSETGDAAAATYHQIDQTVMNDAVIIPVETVYTPLIRSTRVHNAIYYPVSVQYDLTQIWLSS